MRASILVLAAAFATAAASPAEARRRGGLNFLKRGPDASSARSSTGGLVVLPSGPLGGRMAALSPGRGTAEAGGRASAAPAQATAAGPDVPRPWCAGGRVVSGFCLLN